MSTTITAENGAEIEVCRLGISVVHPEGIAKIWARLSADHRRALSAALAPTGGQWTRDDLPGVHWPGIHGEPERQGAEKALDAVVTHLNAHHPKPEQSVCAQSDNDEPMMPRETLRERTASDGRLWNQAYAEGVASAERTCDELRSLIEGQKEHVSKSIEVRNRMRRERDAAVARAEKAERVLRERDEQEDDATRAACERAEQAERDRDEWKARATLAEQECENWRVTAINRAAPAVSRADIEKAILPHILYPANGTQDLIDDVHALVSGDDPAVYVVRESDLPEVSWTSDGWTDGTRHGWEGTSETAMECVETHLEWVRFYLAASRAIEAEQAVDPVELLAGQIEDATRQAVREVIDALGKSVDTQAVEDSILATVGDDAQWLARHVLGQEAGDE